MKLLFVVSMTRARKISEIRSASTRFSPTPATFTSASSRSMPPVEFVTSRTRATGNEAQQLLLDLFEHVVGAGRHDA